MKDITSRIETTKVDPSGYNDLYMCIVTVDGREYRSPRNYGLVRDAKITALGEALDAGAITDEEAWEVFSDGQTDGCGLVFLSKW